MLASKQRAVSQGRISINEGTAVIIGSGPNGLAAGIALAQAGFSVEVFEAQQEPGGAARSLDLTLPSFHHDFGSAVYPMAAASPIFRQLSLERCGLKWLHAPAVVAHPLDDGTAIILERNLDEAVRTLETDGPAWRGVMEPLVGRWEQFAAQIFRPVLSVPHFPLGSFAAFGIRSVLPAVRFAHLAFRNARTKALFAGLAAHSCLGLDEPFSSSFGIVLAAAGHAVGWPIPEGGSGRISQALLHILTSRFSGRLVCGHRVYSLNEVSSYDLRLCDITPRQLAQLAGPFSHSGYVRKLAQYRYGPGAFKVDYALSSPIPWKAPECTRAATVHLGGSLEEIAASERAARFGEIADRPFVLLAQPTLFDATRAPEGCHIAWAYCHVPNGSTANMLEKLERQIERFAPGFRDCVLARSVLAPSDLQAMNENLIGGDVAGGAMDWRQLIFRPTWRQYRTPWPGVYLCSSSTPPGGGVHGMCGFHAAQTALRDLGVRVPQDQLSRATV